MKKNVKSGVYTRNGVEENFNFFTSLKASDKIKFVNFVTNLVVDDSYNSILKDMIFDFAIVDIFTDIDTSEITKSPNAINMIEDLLEETNIVDIVKVNVESGLVEELDNAVSLNIEYKTGIHKNPIAESLSHLLNTIEQKVSGIDTDSMMQMAEVISGMSGELTADKMLEAYSKSDMFKQKYEQVLADRKEHEKKITLVK